MPHHLCLSQKKGAKWKITLLHKAKTSKEDTVKPTAEELSCTVAISDGAQREVVLNASIHQHISSILSLANFPTSGIKASTLHDIMWEATEHLEWSNFIAIFQIGDGSSPHHSTAARICPSEEQAV